MKVQGSGFRVRVQGSGFRVQGSGFRIQGTGFRFQGSGCRVQGSGFRFQGAEFRVQGSGDVHLAHKLGEDGHVPHGVVQHVLALDVRLDLRERISSVYHRSERSRTFGTTPKTV